MNAPAGPRLELPQHPQDCYTLRDDHGLVRTEQQDCALRAMREAAGFKRRSIQIISPSQMLCYMLIPWKTCEWLIIAFRTDMDMAQVISASTLKVPG